MLNLRYHHLNDILRLEDKYQDWLREKTELTEKIQFNELYKRPEIALEFVDEYTQELAIEAELGAQGYLGSAYQWVSMEQWHDYAKPDGSGALEYGKRMKEFYLAVLLAEPSEKIRVTYEPDGICGACQGGNHNEGRFGDHCHKEYRMFHDYAWDLALENTSRYFKPEAGTTYQDFHKMITENGPTMELSIEILRSQKFLTELEIYYGGAEEYVYKGLAFLEWAGILTSDERGYSRVSEAYFKGEKGN